MRTKSKSTTVEGDTDTAKMNPKAVLTFIFFINQLSIQKLSYLLNFQMDWSRKILIFLINQL